MVKFKITPISSSEALKLTKEKIQKITDVVLQDNIREIDSAIRKACKSGKTYIIVSNACDKNLETLRNSGYQIECVNTNPDDPADYHDHKRICWGDCTTDPTI